MHDDSLDQEQGPGLPGVQAEVHAQVQLLPVKMYRADDRLSVAAPMPGMQPEDIAVEVTADGRLVLRADPRGTFKGVNETLLDEWDAGGYSREIALPNLVDATLANLTYGNGVLVVVLPLSQQTRPAKLTLAKIGRDCGLHAGSAGHPIRPVSAARHQSAQARAAGPRRDQLRA